METITKVALVVGGLFIANKVFSKPKATTTTEEGEETTSGGGVGGGGGFPMIPTLGLPILPLGLTITKSDAEIKAEAEAKAKAVLDSVQQKIKDMQKATSSTVVTPHKGTIGDQLGTSTSTSTGSTGGVVGGGTSTTSGSTVTRMGAPTPIGGVVPFDGTIDTMRRKPNFR
jgi:hypothetical protein